MTNAPQPHPTLEERVYNVELITLLGKRIGTLGLKIAGGQFSGLLWLMKAENQVQGSIAPDGHCCLCGSIRTRMATYSVEGEGLLLPERMELLLRCAGRQPAAAGNQKGEINPCTAFIGPPRAIPRPLWRSLWSSRRCAPCASR